MRTGHPTSVRPWANGAPAGPRFSTGESAPISAVARRMSGPARPRCLRAAPCRWVGPGVLVRGGLHRPGDASPHGDDQDRGRSQVASTTTSSCERPVPSLTTPIVRLTPLQREQPMPVIRSTSPSRTRCAAHARVDVASRRRSLLIAAQPSPAEGELGRRRDRPGRGIRPPVACASASVASRPAGSGSRARNRPCRGTPRAGSSLTSPSVTLRRLPPDGQSVGHQTQASEGRGPAGRGGVPSRSLG